MKKTNYLLLVFASIVFALCVSSFAYENDASLTPKQKLAANIEKYAAEKEIKDPFQASWDYHKNSPKEEWLPIWKEILLNGTLAESATNWLDFAEVPLYFLRQTKTDDPNFTNIVSEFKKLCSEPDHFTLEVFADELLNFRNWDLNWCYPPDDNFSPSLIRPQRIVSTKRLYHIYILGDLLKFLGLENVIGKIVSDKLDWLKKTHYSPLDVIRFNIGNLVCCLGDIAYSGYDAPMEDASKCPFKPDYMWRALYGFANHYGMRELFVKGLKEAAEIHNDYFPLGKYYCDNILESDRDAAREFLKKYYPFEKICRMPDALPSYVELCHWLDLSIEPGIDSDYVYLTAQWQLYRNPEQFCRWGTWFWQGNGESAYEKYGEIKRKVAKPMLEALDTHTKDTIRRLGELSDIEDFTCYLRNKFKKTPSKELAFELAVITDDPEEFEKALDIISYDAYREYGGFSSVSQAQDRKRITISEGEISCIIKNLRDEFPASCARKIFFMIKDSGIASNCDFPYYANKFLKWCENKEEKEVAAELEELIKETKVIKPEWWYAPVKYLNKKYGLSDSVPGSDFFPGSKFGIYYYKNTPQYEWLPVWKSILMSGDLSQAVSNWLLFAKAPMQNLKDNNEFIKRELNERFRNYCSENGKFTFNEFVEALVNAPVNEEVKVRDDAFMVYSSLEKLRPVLDSLTFYQIVDVLEYLDCTNDISRVSARAGIDFSKNKKR